MNLYCLDTNIISYILKNNQTINSKVKKAIQKGDQLCITMINYYEISRGLLYLKNKKKTTVFKKLCQLFDILQLDKKTFELSAKIYNELRLYGELIEDADLIIAANCIINDATLVTNNMKHFKRIEPLKCENWL